MADTIISVENLSKAYLVAHRSAKREAYATLRDVMVLEARNLVRKTADLLHGRQVLQGDSVEEFWALKDINFQVKQGEIIGIIGRNGAGKSTLLKILSRITDPTAGRVALTGRVSSLLEVGTGFHPELTGRENIFLNGAILGLTRSEIRRQFDAIVAFAEIETFLDTPVKRYSSGMYVRLAFAVAAHLQPDILIVDEVLAVGDSEFQKKCLGKMDESAKSGRTVLFVSHDMRRAGALCSRGILLDAGRIVCDGPMSQVIETYLAHHVMPASSVDLRGRNSRASNGDVQFQAIELVGSEGLSAQFTVGERFTQHITVRVNRRVGPVVVYATVFASDGVPVFSLFSPDDDFRWTPETGDFVVRIAVDRLQLYPGTYSINLWLADRNFEHLDSIARAATFSVIQEGSCITERALDRADGLVVQEARWSWDLAGAAESDKQPRTVAALAGGRG